jgi:hypothetical protein
MEVQHKHQRLHNTSEFIPKCAEFHLTSKVPSSG